MSAAPMRRLQASRGPRSGGAALVLALAASACSRTTELPPLTDPAAVLSERLLPGASRQLVDPPIAADVRLEDQSGEPSVLEPGEAWFARLSFRAPSADVIGLGLRIGGAGPIHVFEQPSVVGRADGVLALQLGAPADLCLGLPDGVDPAASGDWSWTPSVGAQCHPLSVEQYAVTADGRVSAPVRRRGVARCAGCETASCVAQLAVCRASCTTGVFVGTASAAGELGTLAVELAPGGRLGLALGRCALRGPMALRLEASRFSAVLDLPEGRLSVSATATADCAALEGRFSIEGGRCDGAAGALRVARLSTCSAYCDVACPSLTACASACGASCRATCGCALGVEGVPRIEPSCCGAAGLGAAGSECACPPAAPDAGVPRDAGPPPSRDAAPADLGAADGGMEDAGGADAGPEAGVDGGPGDGGEDAGPTPDAESDGGEPDPCAPCAVAGDACFADTCVPAGPLRVSAAWTEPSTDVDVHVRNPDGFELWAGDRFAGGGELDPIDDGPAGIESARYVAPASGAYEVWLVNQNLGPPATVVLEIENAGVLTSTIVELSDLPVANPSVLTVVVP